MRISDPALARVLLDVAREEATMKVSTIPLLAMLAPAAVQADIHDVTRCQRAFAHEGARYATRIINSTLKCTIAVTECQVQCEQGVFGPPCDTNPPPCCDPDDPGSNDGFSACLEDADAVCAVEATKQALYEQTKQDNITRKCDDLSQSELCGAETDGLHFGLLNAGCLALDPSYVCTLPNLVACVGGPLERALIDQVSAVLHPRAPEAVAALGLQATFPDVPVARKVKEDVAEGKVDVWALSGGQAGDEIVVKVRTGDDNANGTSNLHPLLTLLDSDQATPVADTTVRNTPCNVPNVCAGPCPLFRRHLPYTRTYHLAVGAAVPGSCTGGKYRLIVLSPRGLVPTLVHDDVDP
jgi:hypothetical protein